MPDQKAELIRRLVKNTDQGKIRWEETADEGSFIASFPDYSVVLLKGKEHTPKHLDPELLYDKPLIGVSIHDESGRVVATITDEDVEEDMDEAFNSMHRMYEQARRQAMGIDKAIESLLTYLDD